MTHLMVTHNSITIHLISDATGTTLQGLAKACIAQFPGVNHTEKSHTLIRSDKQLRRTLDDVAHDPGPVLYTLVNADLRKILVEECARLQLPCIPILDPIMEGLSYWLGMEGQNTPGLQYRVDDDYFKRIDAVDYALAHDDGQNLAGLEQADIVLIGVSRTSKTPTCMYLAHRGIRAGNIPLVPSVQVNQTHLTYPKPLYIGLTESVGRLVSLRKNRLKAEQEILAPQLFNNDYLGEDQVEEEVRNARRLFAQYQWPVIDVTNRSVEETAAEILILLERRKQ